jgi:hypothetical protein
MDLHGLLAFDQPAARCALRLVAGDRHLRFLAAGVPVVDDAAAIAAPERHDGAGPDRLVAIESSGARLSVRVSGRAFLDIERRRVASSS